MAAIHAEAFPAGERWGPDAMALQLGLPGGFGFIMGSDHGPVGFVLARVVVDEAEILTLAVVPSEQRRGCGRALLMAALGEACDRGAVAMFLEVAETNGPAIALYASAGFFDVGRRERYYPGGGAARVLRRRLAINDGATATTLFRR